MAATFRTVSRAIPEATVPRNHFTQPPPETVNKARAIAKPKDRFFFMLETIRTVGRPGSDWA